MKKAFTLAEIMIVLMVIGILTAILLPSARQAIPNENVMKFKKGHNALHTAIRELVNSDNYYCNGDLGIMSDCTTKVLDNEQTRTYLCESIADVINAKEKTCIQTSVYNNATILLSNEYITNIATGTKVKREVTTETIKNSKITIDDKCKKSAVTVGKEITLNDNTVFYQSGTVQFGAVETNPNANNGLANVIYLRYFSPPNEFPANYSDQNGFDISYKIYCMDVDGIPDNATANDCVNECPFGYGIRADGKITNGAKADEWLEKSIQEKD